MTSALPASEAPPAAGLTPATPAAPRRLDWIEAGRGLAALGVVFSHFCPWGDPVGHPYLAALRPLGGWGVEFFFVLSGFIILYVHARDLGEPAAAPRYVRRRLVRILPTYWLVLALSLIANQTVQIAWARQTLTVGYLGRQILLLPGDLMVGQAWTLRHEFLFYGVFLTMILWRRLGLAIFAAWMALAIGNLAVNGMPTGMVSDGVGIALHHYNIDFVIGMGIALAARRDRLAVVTGGLWAGALALALVSALGAASPIWHALMLKLAFGGVVGAAVIASRRGVPVARVLLTGGAISYVLYISHELSGTAVGGVLRRLHLELDAGLTMAMRVIAAIAVALVIHRLYERPVLRRLNGTGRPRPAPAGTGHAPACDHSASSNMSCAFCAVADSRTVSPSTSATRPSGI